MDTSLDESRPIAHGNEQRVIIQRIADRVWNQWIHGYLPPRHMATAGDATLWRLFNQLFTGFLYARYEARINGWAYSEVIHMARMACILIHQRLVRAMGWPTRERPRGEVDMTVMPVFENTVWTTARPVVQNVIMWARQRVRYNICRQAVEVAPSLSAFVNWLARYAQLNFSTPEEAQRHFDEGIAGLRAWNPLRQPRENTNVTFRIRPQVEGAERLSTVQAMLDGTAMFREPPAPLLALGGTTAPPGNPGSPTTPTAPVQRSTMATQTAAPAAMEAEVQTAQGQTQAVGGGQSGPLPAGEGQAASQENPPRKKKGSPPPLPSTLGQEPSTSAAADVSMDNESTPTGQQGTGGPSRPSSAESETWRISRDHPTESSEPTAEPL